MQKIIIFIICILSIFGTTNAFFGSSTSLDLYKNIDKGIIELENKMINFELEGGVDGGGILSEINKLAELEKIPVCLNENKVISITEFDEIVKNDNIEILNKYIKKGCFLFNTPGKKNSKVYSVELLQEYIKLFKIHGGISNKNGKTKTSQMYKISNIGLYSDGNLENSGFDLIVDIQEIDEIIFASENQYFGDPLDFDKIMNNYLNKTESNIKELKNKIENNKDFIEDTLDDFKKDENDIEYSPLENNNDNNKITKLTNTNYLCPGDLNNNGLSTNTLDFLLNDINNYNGNYGNQSTNIEDNIINIEGGNEPDSVNNDNESTYDKIVDTYKKIRDNSEWPCEKFFCITIEEIMYEQPLFGGSENITIEYLLNRSNEHLKKFAATSLIPAKMTTNNFEIGLKDLNLGDIFHLSFQVSTKPVPILDIESNSKKDETEYASKNMLEEYYKANGLEYKRRNDLSALDSTESDKQNNNAGAGLSIYKVNKKWQKYNDYKNIKKEKIEFINKSVEKKVSYGVMQTFEEQFAEISKFTVGINNYIKNMDSIILEMKKIPIDKG